MKRDLERVLGPVDATCIVVGAIIGVGIFFTPSRVAMLAGSPNLALLTWAIGGAIALTGALTFAELGGLYPRSGGQYEILRDAYGALTAFLYVFCNATAVQAGAIAIIAIICTQNLGVAFGGQDLTHAQVMGISSILIVGLVVANALGAKWGSRIQNATTFAKVATLLAVTVLAITADRVGQVDVGGGFEKGSGFESSGIGLVCAALVPTLFAFGGWQQALWIAGEVRQPQRNVPLAIVLGVLVVVAVYLLVNWAYLHLLGYAGVTGSKALATDAVAAVWPNTGRRVIAGAVAVSAFGVLNAQLLAGPRLIYGMASDGRFFRPFAGVSARFGTPLAAIVLLGVIALGLLVAAGEQGADKLLTGVVFVDGIFFALTGFAVLVLRRKLPDAPRPARVPLYPLIPILFVFGEIGVVIGAYFDPDVRAAAQIGAAWIVAAAVIYFLFFRRSRGGVSSDC